MRVVDGARTYLRGKLLDAPRTAFRVTLVPGENESLMDRTRPASPSSRA